MIDRPTTIRPGEELDTSRLRPFLERELPDLEGAVELLQFPSGWSNLTYLLRIGEHELVLRRPPFGRKPKSGHDMSREYTILRALQGWYPYCPRPLAVCDDESVIGVPFYLMERLEGIIIRQDLPMGLELEPTQLRTLFDAVVDAQAALHALDFREVGLADFGNPEGYALRQIRGWSDRYRRARTPDVPDCESVMRWLEEKLPLAESRASIVHNDFRLDNVVLDANDPMRIVGVLDWEMAAIGDPLMDLGASLAYWIEASDPPELHGMRLMPTHLEGAPTRAEVVERYAEGSGIEIASFDFYYCYGLFRLAAIIQQIYYRSYHGQTDDPRFRKLNHVVGALEAVARRVMARA
jgi:aminoglycoside phosphotransferase (APT) family kinase protein